MLSFDRKQMQVDELLDGLVERFQDVLPPGLLKELHEYLRENEDLRKVYLASAMLGRFDLRDNVPKFVLKLFTDVTTGVDKGYRKMVPLI